MLNFNSVVTEVLLEGVNDAPKWLQDVMKKHAQLNLGPIDDAKYNAILAVAFRPIQNRIKTAEWKSVENAWRILDAIELYKEQTGQTGLKGTNRGILADDKEGKGQQIADGINQYTSAAQWQEPQASVVSSTYYAVKEEHDKMAKVALSTFNNKSVLETVKEIVKRRTNIFDRISNLKSISQPFTQLITDIFKTPAQYASGAKKVSSDYFNIVDSLYVTNIIEVAQYAKEFFKAEIAGKKVSPQDTDNTQNTNNTTTPKPNPTNPPPNAPPLPGSQNTQQTSSGPVPDSRLPSSYANVPITQGLNLFDTYLNSVLISETNILQKAASRVGQAISQSTVGRGAQALNRGVQRAGKALMKGERELRMTPQAKQRYEQYKKHLEQDQANFEAFLNGKVVKYKVINPETGQETGEVKDAGPYTVGYISQMNTPEAINLINALKKIAEYTSKGVGAGERLRHAGSAMGAAAGFGGAKLYG